MKTAMTELMQWMTKNEFMVNMAFIDKVNECFEKEKEQLIKSWHNGYNNQSPMIDEANCGQTYYNQTYNQNK